MNHSLDLGLVTLQSGIVNGSDLHPSTMASSFTAAMAKLYPVWLECLACAGDLSQLVRDTQSSASAVDHRKRILEKFSPSTLTAYFSVWKNWCEFAVIHNVSPYKPPPSLVADFLQQASTNSQSRSALNVCKAFSWWAKNAGLDHWLTDSGVSTSA